MKINKILGCLIILFSILSCDKDYDSDDDFLGSSGNFTDRRDNQKYSWVRIGSQIWMSENLKFITDESFVYVDDESNEEVYGRLYDYNNALQACPDGWHIPSKDEWNILVDYLGGPDVAGGKMKETGFAHWLSPNTGATNESGFSAIASGYRTGISTYSGLLNVANYWTSTAVPVGFRYTMVLSYHSAQIGSSRTSPTLLGKSARCIKDE